MRLIWIRRIRAIGGRSVVPSRRMRLITSSDWFMQSTNRLSEAWPLGRTTRLPEIGILLSKPRGFRTPLRLSLPIIEQPTIGAGEDIFGTHSFAAVPVQRLIRAARHPV